MYSLASENRAASCSAPRHRELLGAGGGVVLRRELLGLLLPPPRLLCILHHLSPDHIKTTHSDFDLEVIVNTYFFSHISYHWNGVWLSDPILILRRKKFKKYRIQYTVRTISDTIHSSYYFLSAKRGPAPAPAEAAGAPASGARPASRRVSPRPWRPSSPRRPWGPQRS